MVFTIAAVAIVFFAILAWGSNELWAMGVIAIAALGITAIRLFWDSWHCAIKVARSSIFIPLSLFLVYLGIQLASRGPYILSIERYTTLTYFLLVLSCACILFLTGDCAGRRVEVKFLVLSIIALGVFESFYGLIQYLGDYDYIWQYKIIVGKGFAIGTLINRNHYALLLNLCICCGFGYFYYRLMRLQRDEKIPFRVVVKNPGAAHLIWILFFLIMMGLALVFSMSRMGIVAMFCAIGMMVIAFKSVQTGRYASTIGLILILAILGLAVYVGIDAVLARYEGINDELESDMDRTALWRDAWQMIKMHPVFGQGFGTFQWTYPKYEKVNPDLPAKYAHNDYLQALAEVGVVGLLLLLWIFAAALREAIKNLKYAHDPLIRGIGLGTIGALTAIALQEVTDFSLYTPGVTVMAALVVGLNIRAASMRKL